MGMVDGDGNLLYTMVYEGYGAGYYFSGGSAAATMLLNTNPLGYRGYVKDAGTGLYYLQSRYYDPTLGRFLNADALVSTDQGLLGNNMLAYCRNNPVKRTDITGTTDECNTDVLDDGNPFNDVGGVYHGGGGWGPGVKSSYYALQNVRAYDSYWQNSNYNPPSTDYSVDPLCFVAGTLVQYENGTKPIEEIEVGDLVWAWNEETEDIALKEVTEIYISETNELVHLVVNGEEIITTPGHPFYSPVKGWTDAAHLRTGDILVLINGEHVVVELVQHEILETSVTVYNFQVEDYHTYFVAGCGALVHNSCNHNSTWAAERRSHWKNAAKTAKVGQDYGAYVATEENIARMKQGLAPIGWDGFPVQLHHWYGIANNFYYYTPVSRTFHLFIHAYK